MEFVTQVGLLDEAYASIGQHQWIAAQKVAQPVFQLMNAELFEATGRTHLPGLGYKRHYMSLSDYLTVLRAKSFAATSLDSVTAISWHKHFNVEGSAHTLIGSLVRHGKQYGINDRLADARAVRALSFISVILANKLSRPGDHRLVINIPSSLSSTNMLPLQLAEAVAHDSRRYDLASSDALVRCRDFGQMKNIVDFDEKMRCVKGSMRADSSEVRGRQVLLIDDLLGSGCTLREAARALKAAGAVEVHALVMAKTRSFARKVMCS